LVSAVQAQLTPHEQPLSQTSICPVVLAFVAAQLHADWVLAQSQVEAQVQGLAMRWSVIGTSWVSGCDD
jgi:hypothetical protein